VGSSLLLLLIVRGLASFCLPSTLPNSLEDAEDASCRGCRTDLRRGKPLVTETVQPA